MDQKELQDRYIPKNRRESFIFETKISKPSEPRIELNKK